MSQLVDAAFEENNVDETGIGQLGNENTGRWSSDEHKLFLDGVQAHGKNWKKIVALIPTRTVVQVRTHAQKFFKKLSKAQASGDADLDPATLMSTTDAAGRARLSSVVRNSRRYSIASNGTGIGGKLRSLPMRQNRGRNNTRCLGVRIGNISSGERFRDSSCSSSNSSSSCSSGGDCGSIKPSMNGRESDDGDGEKQVNSGAEHDRTFRTDISGSTRDAHMGFKPSRQFNFAKASYGGGRTAGGTKKPQTPKKSSITPPKKPSKVDHVRERGAADARALAWEAATFKDDGDPMGIKYATSSRSNWISPTSVSDIKYSFIPFTRKHTDALDAATTNHLPQRITPTWCTKPPNNWIDGLVDSTDAGPFRWFIDERSLAQPGEFFQPPAETWWSGSYTTDASYSAGGSSGGEAVEGDFRATVPKSSVSEGEVVMTHTADNPSTSEGVGGSSHLSRSKERRSVEHTTPADAEVGRCSSADALLATHIGEVGNLDFSCGLWTDHPQESPSSSFMCGLGLGPPSQAESLWNAPLPPLDEEEAMGFLALGESADASHVS